jgi:signal recognition particle receptor subunit beta
MAVIDPRNDAVVIRIVYDGAPMAGKTTSVWALGKGLGANVVTPGEIGGRTLYFDWLDYTGGLFEGRRIRCQIISVPGQATLAPRRRRLLESADAIVFVCDSSPEAFEADRGYLSGLTSVLGRLNAPPVGIVMQANKRDHPLAVPMERLREMLDGLGMRVGVVESVATEGAGIRETFVFAVRLALDRVRELMRTGQLKTIAPSVDSADDLLTDLKQSEDGSLDLAAVSGLKHTRLNEARGEPAPVAPVPVDAPLSLAARVLEEAVRENEEPEEFGFAPVDSDALNDGDFHQPLTPDERVASGMIWPPVDGRLILHELSQADIQLTRSEYGDWSGIVKGRWHIHSAAEAVYPDLDEGRAVLVQWARLHVASTHALSGDRCVVLVADGHGNYRLWQVVRKELTLREQIEQALRGTPEAIVSALLVASHAFMQAAERISSAACELSLSMQNLAALASGGKYVGLMPDPAFARPASSFSEPDATHLFSRELEFALPALLARRGEVLAALNESSRRTPGILSSSDWLLVRRFVDSQ